MLRNHNPLIAIQGSIASFHDLAAKKYFGDYISTLQCESFKEVCDKIAAAHADYGVIAIENKVAGSILLNYQLIDMFDLRIMGEIFLPIKLQLLAKKDVELKDIKEIVSHPMALGQTQLFLAGLKNIIVTEYRDTSTSAQLIAENIVGTMAVIAGPAVAKQYNLKVLVDNICDVKTNFTRFYILSKNEDFISDPDKASITLKISNIAGTLSDILLIIKNNKLNLTKIQSIPVCNDDSAYSFLLDVEFQYKSAFEKTIVALKAYTKSLKILGMYKGQKIN